jgi:hypothetical protein
MRISGVMPLRNAVKLGYPFELAIRSLRHLCDEVVVLVDPTSEDDTLARVRAVGVDVVVESPWDMSNHAGHSNCEISIQTQKACDAASGDWIISLQADEVLHEDESAKLRQALPAISEDGVAGVEMRRLYFYGRLDRVRDNWTQWLLRLFKRGLFRPDADGAMKFEALDSGARVVKTGTARIFHYSRVGDPVRIAERVRNLDGFFHPPDRIADKIATPYDFTVLRKLDTYVIDHGTEVDQDAHLIRFPLDAHPRAALDHFR